MLSAVLSWGSRAAAFGQPLGPQEPPDWCWGLAKGHCHRSVGFDMLYVGTQREIKDCKLRFYPFIHLWRERELYCLSVCVIALCCMPALPEAFSSVSVRQLDTAVCSAAETQSQLLSA